MTLPAGKGLRTAVALNTASCSSLARVPCPCPSQWEVSFFFAHEAHRRIVVVVVVTDWGGAQNSFTFSSAKWFVFSTDQKHGQVKLCLIEALGVGSATPRPDTHTLTHAHTRSTITASDRLIVTLTTKQCVSSSVCQAAPDPISCVAGKKISSTHALRKQV